MTKTAFPWGSTHRFARPAADVDLDAAEQLAIQRVLAHYIFALDQHDLVALESVMTEDASWVVRTAGQVDPGPFIGRAAILDFVQRSTETQTDQRRHHLINVAFHGADADTAAIRAYLMLTSDADGKPTLVTTGVYGFELERAGREWRIARLFLGLDNAE